jgi:hypothetical protein
MKPGDLIEWYYNSPKKLVIQTEQLWSSLMQQWIPIGIISTLLYQDKETYGWTNSKGCFCARMNDNSNARQNFLRDGVSTCVRVARDNQ